MPQRLKSLELQGYKTFASRNLFEFSKNITAIVGPNGSGKSNITDAIRWVLGEQSFSILRGRKSEDMIFSGSETRPRASMASATMIFDNLDQWLPIEFSEVAITRRAYRDGQNEYLINGQKVRLKDVNTLIASAGLAERTYTVIGQGLVDVALALKADERRLLFEEAAGIGLYRSRREEAIHRLDATRRNLERIQDIISELEPRLRSLEKQVRRLEEVEQIKKDLNELLLEWYGFHWHKEQSELSSIKEAVLKQQKELQQSRKNLEKQEEENNLIKLNLESLIAQRNTLKNNLSAVLQEQKKIEQQEAVFEERKKSFEQQHSLTNSEIIQTKEEIEYVSKSLAEAEQEKISANEEFTNVREKGKQAEIELNQQKDEWDKKNQEYLLLLEEQENLIKRRAEFEAVANENAQRVQRLKLGINERISVIDNLTSQIQELTRSKVSVQQNLQDIQIKYHKIQKELIQKQQEEKILAGQKKDHQSEKNQLETKLIRLKTQYDVLDQTDRNLSDYNQAARFIIQNSRQVTGILGVLGPHLQIPPEYEKAIAAILGEYADTILLENNSPIEEIIDTLNQKQLRGILLLLNEKLELNSKARLELVEQEGVIGWIDEVVKTDEKYQEAIHDLFKNVLLVHDREIVKQLKSNRNDDLILITLNGEIYYPNGVIINAGNIEVGKLRRPRQKAEILKQIQELENQIKQTNEKLDQIEDQLRESSSQINSIQTKTQEVANQISKAEKNLREQELQIEQNQTRNEWLQKTNQKEQEELQHLEETQELMEIKQTKIISNLKDNEEEIKQKKEILNLLSIDSLQSQINQWEIYLRTSQKSLMEIQRHCEEKREQYNRLQKSLKRLLERESEITNSLDSLQTEIEGNTNTKDTIEKEITEISAQLDPLEQNINNNENLFQKNSLEIHQVQQKLIQLEQKFAQTRISLTRQQERFETLGRRIEEDFGLVAFEYAENVSGPTPLPIEGMVEKLPLVKEISNELEENIKRYRSQIKRLGPLNMEVRLEYQEVNERYHFLMEQLVDLEKAEQDIRQIINELDSTMQHDFKTTFELVAEEFKNIFSRLFSGGNARLILTNSDDLAQAGIEIEARLPGKRTQGLSLLSGGERSLTAVALIFALLKVSPTPFCVLDEVDAMLDETNVGRFRDLLSELSQNTQFIIVTHNRNTVQVADVVYGVSMGKDSTSQVISLRLEELDQVIKEDE